MGRWNLNMNFLLPQSQTFAQSIYWKQTNFNFSFKFENTLLKSESSESDLDPITKNVFTAWMSEICDHVQPK
jgi:hypothetical protein